MVISTKLPLKGTHAFGNLKILLRWESLLSLLSVIIFIYLLSSNLELLLPHMLRQYSRLMLPEKNISPRTQLLQLPQHRCTSLSVLHQLPPLLPRPVSLPPCQVLSSILCLLFLRILLPLFRFFPIAVTLTLLHVIVVPFTTKSLKRIIYTQQFFQTSGHSPLVLMWLSPPHLQNCSC